MQDVIKWFNNNVSWFIPLVVSAIFSTLAIWLSFRNTKIQSTENHRPYLTITDLEGSEPWDNGYIILSNLPNRQMKLHEYGEADLQVGCKIRIKNLGYGIASCVKLLQGKQAFKLFEAWDSSSNSLNCLSLLDIGVNNEEEIKISINDYLDFNPSKNTRDIELSVTLFLMYSDLYGNGFCSSLILYIDRLKETISYTFYPEKTANFNQVLDIVGVKYRVLKYNYKRLIYKNDKTK